MKNIYKRLNRATVLLLLSASVLSMLSSCRSHKDLTVLKDVNIQGLLKGTPQTPPPYKIGKNDNLYVSIISSNAEMNELYNPAFAGNGRMQNNSSAMYNEVAGQYIYGYQLDLDGNIALPLIGKINVIGLSLKECEASILAKAKEYLKDVTVKVRLLTFRISVMGEVNKPGVYYNYNSTITVLDAISMANGITNYALLEKVLVLRPTEQGSQTFYLNLTSKESLTSGGYFLQPNDIVIVEPAKYKNLQLRSPVYSIFISTAAAILLFVNLFK